MKTDYFADLLKNQRNQRNQRNQCTDPSNDAASSGGVTVTSAKNANVTNVTSAVIHAGPERVVTSVTSAKNANVTQGMVPEPSNDAASSGQLRQLRQLRQKTDDFANTAPADGTLHPFGELELKAIKQGHAVKVWSGVLEDWLFLVRDEERKAKAVSKGNDAWRLWTLAELTAVQGMNSQDLQNLHTLKRQFNGTLQPGEPPARWRDALEPLQPTIATAEVQL